MSNIFYVYAYIDSTSGTPFYIGKGKKNRRFDHLRSTKKSHLSNKIRKMISGGNPPTIITVQQNLTEAQAYQLEIDLINLIGRLDKKTGPLLNLTNGGTGGAISPDIVREFHSRLEYRENARNRMIAKWSDDHEREAQSERIKQTWHENNIRRDFNKTFMSDYWYNMSDQDKKNRVSKLHSYYTNAVNQQLIDERHQKISSTLKVTSNFVKNNPKSKIVVTPHGTFNSKRQAAKACQTTPWKFDKLLLLNSDQYYLLE